MFGESILSKRLQKKVWRMNRSAKGLLMVTTNLDGFSLANCRQLTKFAKLSRYTVIVTFLGQQNLSLILLKVAIIQITIVRM